MNTSLADLLKSKARNYPANAKDAIDSDVKATLFDSTPPIIDDLNVGLSHTKYHKEQTVQPQEDYIQSNSSQQLNPEVYQSSSQKHLHDTLINELKSLIDMPSWRKKHRISPRDSPEPPDTPPHTNYHVPTVPTREQKAATDLFMAITSCPERNNQPHIEETE